MAVDLALIEQGIHDWLVAATGLVVITADDDAPQPGTDYITYSVSGPRGGVEMDTRTRTLDESQPNGQEVGLVHEGHRLITVTVNCFTAAKHGATWALPLLAKAAAELGLLTVRARLRATASVAVQSIGDVRNAAAIAGPRWQGRAVLEVFLYAVETASERVGYIDAVRFTANITEEA